MCELAICSLCRKVSNNNISCLNDKNDKIYLCSDCIKESGFCYGCGTYDKTNNFYKNSEIEGFCKDCVTDIIYEDKNHFIKEYEESKQIS